MALFLISGLLEHASTPERANDLLLFSLPILTINFDEQHEPNRLLREEQSYDISPEYAQSEWNKLNVEQLAAAEKIINAIEEQDEFSKDGAISFLNGPGGTGKTMLQNTVMTKLRSQQRVVLAVASSSIAATLLEDGRTAHSRFKIPLDAEANSRYGITKESNLGNLLQRTELIFWDEAPMQSKHDFEAVNCVLQDICDTTADFGGKVVCFCGNFRQTLPVIPQE